MTEGVVNPAAANVAAPQAEMLTANAERIRDSFLEEAVSKGLFADTAEAAERLAAAEAAVATDHRLTVNMTTASLSRFLDSGRAETFWDHRATVDDPDVMNGMPTANKKNIHTRYEEYRKVAEEGLRQFAPADATRHEPVYAAVAGSSRIDQMQGAAPSSGNWWIELDDSFDGRAVYNFSDSHAALQDDHDGGLRFDASTVLDQEGALAAKAVCDLNDEYVRSLGLRMVSGFAVNADMSRIMNVAGRKPGYVEAAIFDEVTPEHVVTIGASIVDTADLVQAGRLLHERPEILDHPVRMAIDSSASQMVRDWLAQRVALSVRGSQESGASERSRLWDELGLSPDATQAEVAAALARETSLTFRELDRPMRTLPSLADFRDGAQWHNYIVQLRGIARNYTDERLARMERLIELQQARIFFSQR
jgi:hypothetical protein